MLTNQQLETTLERVQQWTHHIDEKVNILLTAQVGLFAILIAPLFTWFEAAGTPYKGLIATAVALQLFAIWQAGRVLFPRTRNNAPHNSVTFFADVAHRSLDKYREDVSSMTDAGYSEELTCQIHACSEIVTNKFSHFKRAVLGTGAGLAILAATYVIYRTSL